MKLLRWTLAGASAYVIYRYSIGKTAKGKDVFVSPAANPAEVPAADRVEQKPAPKRPRRKAVPAKR